MDRKDRKDLAEFTFGAAFGGAKFFLSALSVNLHLRCVPKNQFKITTFPTFLPFSVLEAVQMR